MTKRRKHSPRRVSKTGDYDVGYGKPPIKTRFKPGQSGNPKGRQRGSKSFDLMVLEELAEKITISENGSRQRITKQRATAKSLVNKAMLGDQRALKNVIGLIPAPTGQEDPAKQAEIERGFKEFVEALNRIANIKREQGEN